uniref:Uncharacterized protein n=2 Tax=Timema TaxID=61471 RepID=A0A7R9BAM0_TIMSH|nr:unnamed protein product [Timema shepardi]CAD7580347.1 unnamed protein product [Timema californicum]
MVGPRKSPRLRARQLRDSPGLQRPRQRALRRTVSQREPVPLSLRHVLPRPVRSERRGQTHSAGLLQGLPGRCRVLGEPVYRFKSQRADVFLPRVSKQFVKLH